MCKIWKKRKKYEKRDKLALTNYKKKCIMKMYINPIYLKKREKNDKKREKIGENMTELTIMNSDQKVKAFDCAKFIIQIYHQIDKQYHCTRSKVEKLLSIADFIVITKYQQSLYEESIVVNPCGTGFSEFYGSFPNDILEEKEKETNSILSIEINSIESALLEEPKFPSTYTLSNSAIPEDVKKFLIEIFIRFGNYEPSKLGKAIDKFKEEISRPNSSGRIVVDIENTYDYFKNCPIPDSFIDEEKIRKEITENLFPESISTDDKERIENALKDQIEIQINEKKIIQFVFYEIVEYVKQEANITTYDGDK